MPPRKSSREMALAAWEEAESKLTDDEATVLIPLSAKSREDIDAYVLNRVQQGNPLSGEAAAFLEASLKLKAENAKEANPEALN